MPYFTYQSMRIHYARAGKGPPMLLLPGNTGSSAIQRGEIRHFSRWFDVVCPDYLGYGRSDRLAELPPEFWWENARMLTELVDHLCVRECVVVGTSGGSLIGLNLAVVAPEAVRCVVADSCPGDRMSAEWAQWLVAQRTNDDPEASRFYRAAHGDDWRQVIDADSAMFLATTRAGNLPCRGKLNEVSCPVLFTAALADHMIEHIEEGVCEAARQIKHAKVVLVSGGAHPLMWSHPELFRREAMRFICEITAQRYEGI